MQEILSGQTESILSKKRGRKSIKENYFDVREETAVRNFLLAETSEEKNKIYNQLNQRKGMNLVMLRQGTYCIIISMTQI